MSVTAPSLQGARWDRFRVQLSTASFYLIAASSVAVLFSIFLSQLLLELALAALLVSRRKLEAPPRSGIVLLFLAWTLVSQAVSSEPLIGFPQVKKFLIFLILVAAYTAFRNAAQVHGVLRILFLASTAAALLAILEFCLDWSSMHTNYDFYSLYSRARITGYMSHWQTFGGQQMLVLAVLLAFLLVSRTRPWWTWVAAALIGLSLLLSFTRGVWLACLAAGVYLLWFTGRRLWVAAIPVVLLVVYLAAPGMVRERLQSYVDVRTDSSNQSRLLMLRTGLHMIREHPIFGVGPEGVRVYFGEYRPPGHVPDAYYGHLHSNYLQFAAERGLPCLALFLCYVLLVFRDQHRLAAHASEYAYIHRGIAAAIVAMMVAGAFEYNAGDSEVAMLFLFYLVYGYTAARGTPLEATDAVAISG